MQEKTELDRVIAYCDTLATAARKAKDKAGPATLQALALHRIACALEELCDEAEAASPFTRPGDDDDAGDADEGEEVTP